MKIIAHIHSDFPDKFGIPRQSGLVENLISTVIFEPPYRSTDALRGLEQYSHLWLIWQFSENLDAGWRPLVRPPKLGGNIKKGVFATRSPFRPNPIGLSSVKLESIIYTKEHGPILQVSGADLMDRTPIYDIKPYLPITDCHPEAQGGFTENLHLEPLQVILPPETAEKLSADCRELLIQILAQDPRPSYQHDPERIYGLSFRQYNIRFRVDGKTLTVCEIQTRR